MSSPPKITVYITNYNYGHYIIKSIESILSQTEKSIEIIIIDDGSTDNSLTLLKSYSDNPSIKIINQKNKGLTVSNNLAIKLAKGNTLCVWMQMIILHLML